MFCIENNKNLSKIKIFFFYYFEPWNHNYVLILSILLVQNRAFLKSNTMFVYYFETHFSMFRCEINV